MMRRLKREGGIGENYVKAKDLPKFGNKGSNQEWRSTMIIFHSCIVSLGVVSIGNCIGDS